MSFQVPPPQSKFFYNGGWDEDTVNVFLSLLMDDVKSSKWAVNGKNLKSVEKAFDYVNVMMEKTFTWNEVTLLMTTLRKRFESFKLVLETPGARWNRGENYVYANNDVWQMLFQRNNFTGAYYHKGEEMYDCLETLFETGVERPSNVITISSDGSGKNPFNSKHFPFIIPDSDEEEEVESPILCGRKPPRKQLFIEDSLRCRCDSVSVELFPGKFLRKPPNNFIGGGSTSNIGMETSDTDSSIPCKVRDGPSAKN